MTSSYRVQWQTATATVDRSLDAGQVLGEIERARAHGVVVVYVFPEDGSGRELTLAITGDDLCRATFQRSLDPPYYETMSEPVDHNETVLTWVGGEATPVCRLHFVPYADVSVPLHEFFAGHDEPPPSLPWTEL